MLNGHQNGFASIIIIINVRVSSYIFIFYSFYPAADAAAVVSRRAFLCDFMPSGGGGGPVILCARSNGIVVYALPQYGGKSNDGHR